MTDFSKYKNITVDNDTYATITKLQTKLAPDVKLSRSQVVKTLVNEKARKLNGRFSKQRCLQLVHKEHQKKNFGKLCYLKVCMKHALQNIMLCH